MKHLFIVGAQRSGTTYLYHLLQSHPQISMAQPIRPEPKFFLNEDLYKRGRRYYEYLYFSDISPNTLCLGEKSTTYIESPMAGERIKHLYPNASIVMLLRNPVTRAYSNYLFTLQNGLEHLGFEEALGVEEERLRNMEYNTSTNPFAYRQRGYYIGYIEEYANIFNPSQIYILIFEELTMDHSLLNDLYKWLGVEGDFIPDSLNQVFNSSQYQRADNNNAFRELAENYYTSLERLEKYLGRKITVWRNHWEQLTLEPCPGK